MVVAATAGAQTARGGKPLALIDHELRFDPRRIALRQLIREGRLGDILHASYILHTPGRRDPSGPWTWWSDAEQGGGMWGAVGSHAIDALRVLLGEVAKVRGRLHTFVRERTDPATGKPRPVTSDDYASAWLELRSGVPAAITVSAVEGERRHELTITGSRGIARLSEGQPLMVKEGTGDWREAANDRDLAPSAELKIPDTDWARAFIRYARAIAGAIRNGQERLEGAADFSDGHRNQVVLDAVRRSAAAGDWVEVAGS
jgi:predicted dehydrogenase